MATRDNRVQTLLDDETFARLRNAAKADHRTVSEYLRLMVERHFGLLED